MELKRILPDVAVLNVKSPDVFVQPDAPPEAKVNTPVELPMFVADVPVALILPVPVTVIPPVPCKSPEPELTPTAVTAPTLVTLNWEDDPTANN